MINKDSIVTAYDEHLTLVEWLQKVESTLKDASAVSFNVNKRGNATLTFSVVFEDGSEIESNPIILEQGESVQGATIRNGHLILTLTNGDELDAGNLGGVSGFNIDASQHLIVTYQNGSTQDLGAIFNGNVAINGALSTAILTSPNDHIEAQKPVVEVMNGYTFNKSVNISGLTYEFIYAGAVKNGNKLTFVVALNITRTGDIGNSDKGIGTFIIPASVGAKLYPTSIGGVDFLGIAEVPAVISQSNIEKINTYTLKQYGTNVEIDATQGSLSALTLNQKYYVRIEMTFLLSENLAG